MTGDLVLNTKAVPDVNGGADLGTSSLRWGNVYGQAADFSGNATVGGTLTATTFSGSGASLTSIPETALTDGSLYARLAADETVTGTWTFNNALTSLGVITGTSFAGSGATLTSIPETAITDGSLFPRLAATEAIAGAWTYAATQTMNGILAVADRINFTANAATPATASIQRTSTNGLTLKGVGGGTRDFTVLSTADVAVIGVVGTEIGIAGVSSDGIGKVLCVKSDATIGTCSTSVDGSGVCTCS